MKDRTAVNHNIRKHFNELIYNTARYTEIALSIVIIIVIALSGPRLILTTDGTSIMDMDTSFFTSFLSQALSLVVGVEFVKMLCRHSAQTVVEVLLFATARQMVVEHLDPVQTLIGIIGIAILFAVRKYLMTDSDDMTPHQKNASEESSKKAFSSEGK
ncbi:MAG: transporter [Blautia sp.]|nr:transporter [Blautia sp.]